jgi:hypothetical protein
MTAARSFAAGDRVCAAPVATGSLLWDKFHARGLTSSDIGPGTVVYIEPPLQAADCICGCGAVVTVRWDRSYDAMCGMNSLALPHLSYHYPHELEAVSAVEQLAELTKEDGLG